MGRIRKIADIERREGLLRVKGLHNRLPEM
jgi:hypothetical protein